MAEADRSAQTGEVARTGNGGVVVPLQLCRSQPAPAAWADCKAISGTARSAVCPTTAVASRHTSRRSQNAALFLLETVL
jgi:hypothetical protein